MSVKIMSQVWPLQLGIADKLVLLALADNANDAGHCWPSIAILTEKTCLCERAVQQSVNRLASNGHLTIQRRPSKPNTYLVHPRTTCTPHDMHPALNASPHLVHPASGDVKTGFPPLISPSHSPSYSPPSERTVKGAQLTLHASLPVDSWEEWLAHRREKRWSMSPRALKPQLKLLAKYDTETQREVIENSLQAGWQGLFAPKGKPAKPNGSNPYKNSI